MRVLVRDQRDEFDEQTRAYAEYRAFSGLVGHGAEVSDVIVELGRRRRNDERDHERIVCMIAARLISGKTEHAEAVARHAYAAIDRAVSLIRRRPSLTAGTPGRTQVAHSR